MKSRSCRLQQGFAARFAEHGWVDTRPTTVAPRGPALRISSPATAASLLRVASISGQGYVMQQIIRQGCWAGSNLTTSPSPSRRKNKHKEQASTVLRRLTTSKCTRSPAVQHSTELQRTTRAGPPALLGTAAQSPSQIPIHAAVSRSIPPAAAQGSRRWYLKPVRLAPGERLQSPSALHRRHCLISALWGQALGGRQLTLQLELFNKPSEATPRVL